MLTSVDDVLGDILNLIPGFYALRFIVYIWMFYPRANNGAEIIYQHLKPQLLKWQVSILWFRQNWRALVRFKRKLWRNKRWRRRRQNSSRIKNRSDCAKLTIIVLIIYNSYLLARTHCFLPVFGTKTRQQFLFNWIAFAICICILITNGENWSFVVFGWGFGFRHCLLRVGLFGGHFTSLFELLLSLLEGQTLRRLSTITQNHTWKATLF